MFSITRAGSCAALMAVLVVPAEGALAARPANNPGVGTPPPLPELPWHVPTPPGQQGGNAQSGPHANNGNQGTPPNGGNTAGNEPLPEPPVPDVDPTDYPGEPENPLLGELIEEFGNPPPLPPDLNDLPPVEPPPFTPPPLVQAAAAPAQTVPEPTSIALTALGLVGAGVARRMRKRD